MRLAVRILAFSCMILMANFSLSHSQTLPAPVFSYYPCIGYPGLTDSVNILPVPGATGYIWSTSMAQINGVLFNGNISTQTTSEPHTNITFVLPQLSYEVCVTAVSSCCTSATSCVLISGTNPLAFDPLNSPVALPSTADYYGLNVGCFQPGSPMIIQWFLTGDITFNNGLQSMTNSIDSVQLNFGPSFTTGTLCAFTVNNFGLASDTICMTINAPVGLSENNGDDISIYHDQVNNEIVVNHIELINKIEIFDLAGRIILNEIFSRENISTEYRIPTILQHGIYLVRASSEKKIFSVKILIPG